jgi:hypothetical protein
MNDTLRWQIQIQMLQIQRIEPIGHRLHSRGGHTSIVGRLAPRFFTRLPWCW